MTGRLGLTAAEWAEAERMFENGEWAKLERILTERAVAAYGLPEAANGGPRDGYRRDKEGRMRA
jgi:hypothetical protein